MLKNRHGFSMKLSFGYIISCLFAVFSHPFFTLLIELRLLLTLLVVWNYKEHVYCFFILFLSFWLLVKTQSAILYFHFFLHHILFVLFWRQLVLLEKAIHFFFWAKKKMEKMVYYFLWLTRIFCGAIMLFTLNLDYFRKTCKLLFLVIQYIWHFFLRLWRLF